MAWTTTDLAAIEKAIVNGTTTVRYDTKSVTYRSIDELIRIRDLIKKELGQTEGGSSTRLYAEFNKGLK